MFCVEKNYKETLYPLKPNFYEKTPTTFFMAKRSLALHGATQFSLCVTPNKIPNQSIAYNDGQKKASFYKFINESG